ncbi:MAG: hypothetical protein RJA52_1173 [Bacteroidota bacterium]|jgi:hypothetical protein
MRNKAILGWLFLCLCTTLELTGQKVLQIEKYGSPKTKKIYIGDQLTYRIIEYDSWATGTIEDLLVQENVLSFHNRFMPIDQIDAFRYDINWGKSIGKQLFWFGTGWSFYAVIGPLTDGEPGNGYRPVDAIVTGSSWILAYSLPRIFKYKTVRFGGKRRLRMLDLTP